MRRHSREGFVKIERTGGSGRLRKVTIPEYQDDMTSLYTYGPITSIVPCQTISSERPAFILAKKLSCCKHSSRLLTRNDYSFSVPAAGDLLPHAVYQWYRFPAKLCTSDQIKLRSPNSSTLILVFTGAAVTFWSFPSQRFLKICLHFTRVIVYKCYTTAYWVRSKT